MKRVLMAVAVMLAMSGSVQAAQKPKPQIDEAHWWQKTTIEIGVGLYMWCHDRFASKPSAWRNSGQRSEPQNKKAPVNPGELSE